MEGGGLFRRTNKGTRIKEDPCSDEKEEMKRMDAENWKLKYDKSIHETAASKSEIENKTLKAEIEKLKAALKYSELSDSRKRMSNAADKKRLARLKRLAEKKQRENEIRQAQKLHEDMMMIAPDKPITPAKPINRTTSRFKDIIASVPNLPKSDKSDKSNNKTKVNVQQQTKENNVQLQTTEKIWTSSANKSMSTLRH